MYYVEYILIFYPLQICSLTLITKQCSGIIHRVQHLFLTAESESSVVGVFLTWIKKKTYIHIYILSDLYKLYKLDLSNLIVGIIVRLQLPIIFLLNSLFCL